MEPIGQCNKLAPNIYLETNTNSSFPIHNKSSSGGSGIDVNGDGSEIGSGGANSSAGFTLTIPILSSLLLILAGVLSSSISSSSSIIIF